MLTGHLLEGIFTVNGLEQASEKEKVEYLRSLRKSATLLWQSFQKQNVFADYSTKEIQECYLLRYFEPYANFLLRELEELEKSYFQEKKSYTVSFFGVGPGSEIIALLHFLKTNTQINKIHINLFDKEPWAHSRKIISNHLIPKFWNPKDLTSNSYNVDFSSSSFWQFPENRGELIIKSDLVIFQNCLNEISDTELTQTNANISGIFNHLSSNSLIVFIDQAVGKYQSTSYMLDQIIQTAEDSPDIFTVDKKESINFSSLNFLSAYPEIINTNLYYKQMNDIGYLEGLVLRKEYYYSSVIFEKSNYF